MTSIFCPLRAGGVLLLQSAIQDGAGDCEKLVPHSAASTELDPLASPLPTCRGVTPALVYGGRWCTEPSDLIYECCRKG